jgi:TonB family protein
LAAAAAAWSLAVPEQFAPSRLIGQDLQVELTVTIAESEFLRPEPVEEEAVASPVRIMPSEAVIARRHFHADSTSVSEPTPAELQWVERLAARPAVAPPDRERNQPNTPSIKPPPPVAVERQATAPPVPRQPGTADRPLPELIHSSPPNYPQSAIQRRWEGTVLLRVHITTEGRVGDVDIVRSSGHDVLDGEAVRAVRSWRFVPAIRDGRPIASAVRLPVRFELSAD